MIRALLARRKQGYRTLDYPERIPPLPERFQGLPSLAAEFPAEAVRSSEDLCPTEAIGSDGTGPFLDLGRCLFCGRCARSQPSLVRFSRDHALSARKREELLVRPGDRDYPHARPLEEALRRLYGRSLKLRQVSAGGCNACEADVNVLSTIAFDLGRFGIQMVASPRHADGLLVTGPVTGNMSLALQKTWEAVPPPRIVIAVGSCAISGGLFRDHPETEGGVAGRLPVDLFVPGCPPHPLTILDGLLRLLGRLPAPRP